MKTDTTLLDLRSLARRAEVLRAHADRLDELIDKLGPLAPTMQVFLRSLIVGQREAGRSLELAAEYWREAHKLHFGYPPEATARPNLRVVAE
jgi:hypothetical protein